MIYLGGKKYTVMGVDVYPDYANPDLYWYVPGVVKLAERNKRKALSYFWYTDSASDADGTGFLNFEVNTAIDDSVKGQIRSKIMADTRKSQINLAAVTYQAGRVNFSVLGPIAGETPASAEDDPSVLYQSPEQLVWSAGSSSLVGDNSAVCSVKFTKEGKLAAAMKQAILKGANSLAATYRLDFLAMRPSVTFKVHGKLDQTVTDFQASIGTSIPLKAFVLDLGVQAQWTKIMKNTNLKFEVVNFTGEEEEGLKWAQQVLLDYVLQHFFEVQIEGKKEWTPLPDNPDAKEVVDESKDVEEDAKENAKKGGKTEEEAVEVAKEVVKAATQFIPKVSIRAGFYRAEESHEIDFLYSEMKAKVQRVAPQALVLEGVENPRSYIREVNRAQDPFGLPYKVQVVIPDDDDCKKIGLEAVNVQAKYPVGARRDSQTVYNLTSTGGEVSGENPLPFQYDANGSAGVEYSVEYVFKPGGDWQAERFQYSDNGQIDKGLLTARPESIIEFLTITLEMSGDFVWEDADQAVVQLTSSRWKGEKRVVFQKGKQDPQTLCIRSDSKFANNPIQYKVEVRKKNKRVYSYGPESVLDNLVTVHDRFEAHIPIFFDATFQGKVETADITVSYSEPGLEWEDQFTLEKGQKRVQRIVPTLKAPAKPSELKVKYEVEPDWGDSYTGEVKGGGRAVVKGVKTAVA